MATIRIPFGILPNSWRLEPQSGDGFIDVVIPPGLQRTSIWGHEVLSRWDPDRICCCGKRASHYHGDVTEVKVV